MLVTGCGTIIFFPRNQKASGAMENVINTVELSLGNGADSRRLQVSARFVACFWNLMGWTRPTPARDPRLDKAGDRSP